MDLWCLDLGDYIGIQDWGSSTSNFTHSVALRGPLAPVSMLETKMETFRLQVFRRSKHSLSGHVPFLISWLTFRPQVWARYGPSVMILDPCIRETEEFPEIGGIPFWGLP